MKDGDILKYAMDHRQKNQLSRPEKRRPKIVPPRPPYKTAQPPPNFILVKLAPGPSKGSLKRLRKIKGICGFHRVLGEFDLVLIIRETNGFDKQAIVKNISGIPGVVKVQTLVAAS
ncbi:MAG: Lrp/AsnC ligand binding domain-containing protein [Thermoplasmata archaeon]